MSFDIATVRWNPEQFGYWKHNLLKHHPDAHIIEIQDRKPVKGRAGWAGGKTNCLIETEKQRHPGRFVYSDTDIVFTRPVIDEIFEGMEKEGKSFAISHAIAEKCPVWRNYNRNEQAKKVAYDFGVTPDKIRPNNTGLILMRDMPTAEIGQYWQWAMNYPTLMSNCGRYLVYDEIALAHVLAAQNIDTHPLPLEIHGNILSVTDPWFGDVAIPACIHYHKKRRLQQVGLYERFRPAPRGVPSDK